MQVEELIPGVNLESENCEFKGIIEEGRDEKGRSREVGWLKTLVAFANSKGGCLYVGVDDRTHRILALNHEAADKVILMIHKLLKERVTPMITYSIEAVSVPGTSPIRYLIAIRVPPCRNLPVSLHENGLLGIYVRIFGRTDMATPEQMRDMVMMSEQIPYDSLFTDIPYDENAFSFVREQAEKQGDPLTWKALVSRRIISEQGMLSRGALLFADECPDGSPTRITATCWPGMDKGSLSILASEQFEGNVAAGIRWAVDFVKNHSTNGFKKEALGQSAYVSYPARSVTEGIVNAAAHRNYYMLGTQIEINIFRDRLEITSPGSLLGVRELNRERKLSAILPRRRNDIVCSMLELLHLMESKGSGFDRIESDYAGHGEAYRPYVTCDASSFTLMLPDLTFTGGPMEDSTELRPVKADRILDGKNDVRILSFCFLKYRSVREIADFLDVKPSTYFRKTVIGRLVKQGLLLERINGRASVYTSNPDHVFV